MCINFSNVSSYFENICEFDERLENLENQSQHYISAQASAAEGNHLHRQNVTSHLSLTQVKHFLSLKRHQLFLPFDMAQEIAVDKLKRRR